MGMTDCPNATTCPSIPTSSPCAGSVFDDRRLSRLSPTHQHGRQPRVEGHQWRLDVALKLLSQAANETSSAADEVGHLSSPINNDDLACGLCIGRLPAGMKPPRRLN
jgi:hypothetical protein